MTRPTLLIRRGMGFTHPMRTSILPFVFVGAAVGSSGCGLLEGDFDTTIGLDADLASDPGEREYDDCVLFNPNDEKKFRDNKDRLDGGFLSRILLELTSIPSQKKPETTHEGTIGVGQIDIRRHPDPDNPDLDCDADGDPFIEAAAEWVPVKLEIGATVEPDLNPAVLDKVEELIFRDGAPLQVHLIGKSDDQVNFRFRSNFTIAFSADFL